MKQTCILVLGMHRSGTSALTGTLGLLDVYLGSQLMEANFANEKGYFENNTLFKINEELLSQIDSSWDDLFYDEIKLENIKDLNKLKQAIKKEFELSDVFAIKDPRLAFLFPVYKKVLEELNIDIKIILPYRNPIEVANSLHVRNDMSMEKGMLLWAYHFLLTEKFSRSYKRVFVGFDKLMSESEAVVKQISNKLDLDLDSKYIENKKEINEFLEPSLKHHNISIDLLSENTPKIVSDILLLKNKFNDVETMKHFDEFRDELFSYQKLFYNNEIMKLPEIFQQTQAKLVEKEQERKDTQAKLLQKEQERKDTQAKLLEKEQERKDTQAKLLEKEQERKDTQAKLLEKEQERKDTQAKLLQKEQERKDTQAKLLKKEQERKDTQSKLLEKEQELKILLQENNKLEIDKNQEISSLQTELTLIYTSKSWKITRPLRKLMRYIK